MSLNRPKSHHYAPVAQWIEQWIPNPCAASSILAGGTIKINRNFHEIVAKGKVITKGSRKETNSFEGQLMSMSEMRKKVLP
jgi:hypothetical protein